MSDNNGSSVQSIEDAQRKLHSLGNGYERDNFCMDTAKLAARKSQWEIVKIMGPQIVDISLRDRCCIETAKIASSSGQLGAITFLKRILSDSSEKIDYFRRECAVAACSHLQANIVESVGLESDWLLRCREILSFISTMAIEGRSSDLLKIFPEMQPAEITQLLRISITQGHVTLAVALMDHQKVHKDHVDVPDDSGATALMLAADDGLHDVIDKLLDLGASVRVQDSRGRTALSRACEAGHVRAAKALVDGGADPSHRDGRGLTCTELEARFFHSQQEMLLNPNTDSSPQAGQAAAYRSHPGLPLAPDDSQRDKQLSLDLHLLLSKAGFTQERATLQQKMADWLEEIARALTLDDRRMTGSYADGWGNNLVQLNGRTASDSDIDWTVLVDGRTFHLEGGCDERTTESGCDKAIRLHVEEGHAQVSVGSGSQPAVSALACGVRPAQDTCHAIQCCGIFPYKMISKQFDFQGKVHLVRATRPNCTSELRVSFSFQEKRIMRNLSTVQGQLFVLIKFLFKRLLPLTLNTPGLKTYHAKTLLLFLLERHGIENKSCWQPQNLIPLLKESLDMMLSFIDSSSSPDVCMPHFFMPDAPLYFKNAGIGGDFDNTKARVRDRLCELRSDIGFVVEQLRRLVIPLQFENFYFDPFTILPLAEPSSLIEIREQSDCKSMYYKYADIYCVIYQCVTELQSESSNRDTLMRQLRLLRQLEWCKCAYLCMTAMVNLKFCESVESIKILMELQGHRVKVGFKQDDIDKAQLPSDWAWRFCLPCDCPPRFPFLPKFTQTLFTARLSQPRSSHLYVNFRCLSWSLQAELLCDQSPIVFDAWIEELQEDPDLEELLTLAHYSDRREHVEFCLRHMETIRDERRVAWELQDEEKIQMIREKLAGATSSPELTTSQEGSNSFATMEERKKEAMVGSPPYKSQWTTIRLLGRGGFGEVHEVLTDTGVSCAAKFLRLPVQLGEQVDLVTSEIQTVVEGEKNLCELQHVNIVSFFCIAQTEPATVVVFMELLDGRSLETFINKTPLEEETIRDFSRQICSGLTYMHSQREPVIHRDVNCSNIIVLTNNCIKLIDFGLSIKLRQSLSHISTSNAQPKGTLNFMAPELVGSSGLERVQYNTKSDIWAFGCSVYQMAAGVRPNFQTSTVFQLAMTLFQHGAATLPDGYSDELRNFYASCTAKDCSSRKSASELMQHDFLRG